MHEIYPEQWGEATQVVENQRKSKWKCKFRLLHFISLPWQDVFPLTLQNTTSNLASAIKRTIKRLPHPPQMLPHVITAWIKREETSEAAANSGEGKVLASHLCLLKLFPSWIEAATSFTSQFSRFGSQIDQKVRKYYQNVRGRDGWRMVKVLKCDVREVGAQLSKICYDSFKQSWCLLSIKGKTIPNHFSALKPPSAL